MHHHTRRVKSLLILTAVLATAVWAPKDSTAQFENRWLSAGSLHNWYSEIGSEREHGFQAVQQFGLRWPAQYNLQDMQAAKALWLGARNFTDQNGNHFAHKVVHVGPRVTGAGVFFPREFEVVSRFEPPVVEVDGEPSERVPVDNDRVDPDMIADRMVYNRVHNQLGLTMERRIMQFSNEHHDNYHVTEYTFTNTGIVDASETPQLNQTLQDAYIFFQGRYSVVRETRYVIGNATGWGINAMLDARGDGMRQDPPDEDFRAMFVWHGRFPPFTQYDNLGGPIWVPNVGVAASDTIGRLGAHHFVGHVTLHADASPTNPVDDRSQPRTTQYVGSDDPLTSANDPFNPGRMEREYALMSRGHGQRHAWLVEPDGNFTQPTGDPALGTPGGFSTGSGYGPYTLEPGESVRLVIAEGASGLSREAATEIGRAYKRSGGNNNLQIPFEVGGQTHSMTKNEWVMTSRDSLFQSFRRAIANFESGFNIPRPPNPPSTFSVSSGGDRISLDWSYEPGGPSVSGFEVYRARGGFDSTYVLLTTTGPEARNFDDVTAIRGVDYYYYVQAVGTAADNTGEGGTPAGVLRSNRHYTQTYTPARLRRPAGPPPSRMVADLAPGQLVHGLNTFVFERAGPGGFIVQRLLVTLQRTVDENGEVREEEYDGLLAPMDFLERPVGTRDTVQVVLDMNDVVDSDLMVGVYELRNVSDMRVWVNDQELALTDELLAPEDPMSAIRIVPNPFNIAQGESGIGFHRDRLGFFNIPGQARIRIYTELGELVDTIEHTDGSGDAFWDLTTSSRQVVVSGVYIAVFDDLETGARAFRKFVVIR